jgi:quercetin dioxygenase-like cupin family protein
MSKAVLLSVVFSTFFLGTDASTSHVQNPGPKRTVLMRRDISVPGYEAIMIRTEVPVGGREGRHTHPGTFVGLVEQGTFRVDYEGVPSAIYKAGDSFFVDAGKIHEGINAGDVPVKVLLTLIVENGATLVTPVK